jgi:hypothetical protein
MKKNDAQERRSYYVQANVYERISPKDMLNTDWDAGKKLLALGAARKSASDGMLRCYFHKSALERIHKEGNLSFLICPPDMKHEDANGIDNLSVGGKKRDRISSTSFLLTRNEILELRGYIPTRFDEVRTKNIFVSNKE